MGKSLRISLIDVITAVRRIIPIKTNPAGIYTFIPHSSFLMRRFHHEQKCIHTPRAAVDGIAAKLTDTAEVLAEPGTMRLMYHDYGIVREDKSLIRHRVFATRLKPGCAEEYKRRHDGLVAARGDAVSEGPDSNFTIWCGRDYIFGYCEKVKAFDRPMTGAERADTIAWETRQLEIMDWLTDDVDWITGERHEAMRRVV